jgi:hypothetical protein
MPNPSLHYTEDDLKKLIQDDLRRRGLDLEFVAFYIKSHDHNPSSKIITAVAQVKEPAAPRSTYRDNSLAHQIQMVESSLDRFGNC